jgi:RNA polymerase sigma-70 factor (ECF subfamily)
MERAAAAEDCSIWLDEAGGAANDGEASPLDDGLDAKSNDVDVSTRAGRPPVDDAALSAWIERIAARDAAALEALYAAASARVHGFVHRFTRIAALTEDVVEDTFWQVWRQAPRFEPQRGRPMTWILAIARSRAIDALRREQRFRHEPIDGDDQSDRLELRADHHAQDLLDATRDATQLHAALRSLEPRPRQLVALAFFRGLTHDEIAEHMALPLGTVKSIIRRALLQLRARLQPAGVAPNPATTGAAS